jgi:MFS family permease
MTVGMFILSEVHSEFILLLGSGVFGASWGMISPTIAAWTVDLATPEKRGRAVASMYIALEAGIGIGALISAHIYGNDAANFFYAFALPGVLAVVALGLLVLWWKKKGKGVLIIE